MRIIELELSGFRGFPGREVLDLDADAIVIVGANGQGKTSVFDGVLWALTGDIPRLPANGSPLSKYTETGEARVSLRLRDDSGAIVTVVRTFDGERERIQVKEEAELLQGKEADSRLLERVWPEALSSSDPGEALTSAIIRSVYLQQDRVRDFLEATSDRERFEAVSELVGIGRITDLQGQLDRGRTNWSRVTNEQQDKLGYERARVESLVDMLTSTDRAEVGRSESTDDWTAWWDENERLGVTISSVPLETAEAPSAIDAAMNQLDALRRIQDRRHEAAAELHAEIASADAEPERYDEGPQESMDAKRQEVDAVRKSLSQSEAQLATERRHQVRKREAHEELKALAQLALRHLGDQCPVCSQSYDIKATTRRLEELATTAQDEILPSAELVASIADQLVVLEQELAELEGAVRQANTAGRELRARIAERNRRLEELGIDPKGEAVGQAVELSIERFSDASSAILSQQRRGEQLALILARNSELARQQELRQQIETARDHLAHLESQFNSRVATAELATAILGGLRAAASDVVRVRLERIEPIFQRIYAMVDPHPSFRQVRLSSRFFNRRGRVDTMVDDTATGISSDSPTSVLSSSQLNALAVSIFLSFNLGLPSLPLQAVLLDDPLQSLDDVNLLGLIDLLRKTKQTRQLLISTHDDRFGALLERKLRPVKDSQRTIMVEMRGWSPKGPVTELRDVERDATPMRIVA